jgi:hypothetical protein
MKIKTKIRKAQKQISASLASASRSLGECVDREGQAYHKAEVAFLDDMFEAVSFNVAFNLERAMKAMITKIFPQGKSADG